MAASTTVLAMPYPEGSDANDVPADIQALAARIDEVPGIESLTSAEISGLAAGEKPAGRVVYNSTTSKLQVSNGTTFTNIDAAALLLAGGTMSGAIAMGGNKVTGLAAASANGDAVRYEQVVATYAEMERPSGTQSIPNGTTTVTYSTETDPSSIANTGTGQLSLTAGVWTLSYFSAVQGGDSYSHYLYAGSRTVDYGYGQTVGLNATVYLSGSTTVYAQIVNASSATTVALARLTAVRIGI